MMEVHLLNFCSGRSALANVISRNAAILSHSRPDVTLHTAKDCCNKIYIWNRTHRQYIKYFNKLFVILENTLIREDCNEKFDNVCFKYGAKDRS